MFDAAQGSFKTTHVAECPDVAPECAVTLIPPHLHKARVQVTRAELTAQYGLRDGMQATLRMPYDIKDQTIRYATLAGQPYTPPYGDIHHRTETLRGISDPSLMFDWSALESWQFGIGTTLPLGHTVPNPVILGRLGLRHEHLQFGSGTFEPKISALYSRGGMVPFFARVEQTLSLYENGDGFRAPHTTVASLGPSFRYSSITIAPSLGAQYQTVARWNGENDEGTGFHNGGLRLQVSVPFRSMLITPGVYRELWSHGFAEQTFTQGTTWSIAISRMF